mgnify:CR=1 FL=1
MQIADGTKGNPTENSCGGIAINIYFTGRFGVANDVAITVIVARKVGTTIVTDRFPILDAL